MRDASYPRDLVGYGRSPPHAQWPGDARIAVQFVLNYEEGGESSVLHGDAGFRAVPVRDHRRGRLPRAPSQHGVDLRVRVAGRRLADPARVRAPPPSADGLRRRHGARAQSARSRPRSSLSATRSPATGGAGSTIRTSTRPPSASTCGVAWSRCAAPRALTPVGWYTGRDSPNTRRLVVEHGGFLYDSDHYGDDLPFWTDVTTADGAVHPHLVVPYTLDTNDMRFATPQGFNTGEQFFAYLRDAFDVLYAEGAERPKMMSIGMHCRLAGTARPLRRAAPLPRSHRGPSIASGCAAATRSPGTGSPGTRDSTAGARS